MSWLFTVDGSVFVLIGLVVLAAPSPQPALVHPVDDARTLVSFKDTRRLLASQFFGSGALSLSVGLWGHDAALERAAALARLVTILIVIGINVTQLRGGHWKRAPLYFISSTLGVIAVTYAALLSR